MQTGSQHWILPEAAEHGAVSVALPLLHDHFCALPRYRDVLQELLNFTEKQEKIGLAVLSGLAGVGKSTLLMELKRRTHKRPLVVVGTPGLSIENLLKALRVFVDVPPPRREKGSMQQIAYVLDHLQENYVLLVDNAHLLPLRTLAALVHLVAAQTHDTLRMRVVLAGDLALTKQIKQLVLEDFEGLPLLQCTLPPLSIAESKQYILKRAEQESEWQDGTEIPERLFNRMHARAKGLPERLNTAVVNMLVPWLRGDADDVFDPLVTERRDDPAPAAWLSRMAPWVERLRSKQSLGFLSVLAAAAWMGLQPQLLITVAQLPAKLYASVPALSLPSIPTQRNASSTMTPPVASTVTAKRPSAGPGVRHVLRTHAAPPHSKAMSRQTLAASPPVSIQLPHARKALTPLTTEWHMLTPLSSLASSAGVSIEVQTAGKTSIVSIAPPPRATTEVIDPVQTVAAITPPQVPAISPPVAPGYTIQVMGSQSLQRLKEDAEAVTLGMQAHIFQTQRAGKPWYILGYGQFATEADAAQHLADLTTDIRKQGAWVRKTERLLALH